MTATALRDPRAWESRGTLGKGSIRYDERDRAAAAADLARRYPAGTVFVCINRGSPNLREVYALRPGASRLDYASKLVGAVLGLTIYDGTRHGVALRDYIFSLNTLVRDLSIAAFGGPDAYALQDIR